MIGAIAGDIIGSAYEGSRIKITDFELFKMNSRFTDDSVMTLAIAYAILNQKPYQFCLKKFGNDYPHRGYGKMFRDWLRSDELKPYNSFGNGSAMRVSAISFAYDSLEKVLLEAKRSAEVTHNHPEGIKGAQAIASAIFLARKKQSKNEIRIYIENEFNYNLNRTISDIRKSYKFDITCQGSVPEAIIAFLESEDYESSIRLGVSLGGDADTIACMTGGISQAFYEEIPAKIIGKFAKLLTPELLEIVEQFNTKFQIKYKLI